MITFDKKLERLTKEKWKALPTKSRWDVLVALRGPDLAWSYSNQLKYYTTAVIRHVMWDLLKPQGGSALVNQEIPGIIIPDSPNIYCKGVFEAKLFPEGFDAAHFITHVKEAGFILGIPVQSLPAAIYRNLLISAINVHTALAEAQLSYASAKSKSKKQ